MNVAPVVLPRSRAPSSYYGWIVLLVAAAAMVGTLPGRLADVVDGADGGVVQGSGRTRFPHQSRARRGIFEGGGGQKLERHVAIEALVMSAIHLAHAARPEHRQDAIVADLPTGHERWDDRLILPNGAHEDCSLASVP